MDFEQAMLDYAQCLRENGIDAADPQFGADGRPQPGSEGGGGGVGIANVMLMSVLERRSEIGLRRALGATRRLIVIQFVAEALILAGLGGVLGVGAGVVIAIGYATTQDWTPVIPFIAVLGGIGAALAIGAVAGLYPAVRAARVSPTDALRGV